MDALAIAPYFGHDLIQNSGPGLTDFAKAEAQLVPLAQRAVEVDVQQQAAVAKSTASR